MRISHVYEGQMPWNLISCYVLIWKIILTIRFVISAFPTEKKPSRLQKWKNIPDIYRDIVIIKTHFFVWNGSPNLLLVAILFLMFANKGQCFTEKSMVEITNPRTGFGFLFEIQTHYVRRSLCALRSLRSWGAWSFGNAFLSKHIFFPLRFRHSGLFELFTWPRETYQLLFLLLEHFHILLRGFNVHLFDILLCNERAPLKIDNATYSLLSHRQHHISMSVINETN